MSNKYLVLLLILFSILSACSEDKQDNSRESGINEVLILGTIHEKHLEKKSYDIYVLKRIIEQIKPDIILTEIPIDRFETAQREFNEVGMILEPRVAMFPEYVDVIFPLSKKMNFEIVPTSAWTQEMADSRRDKLTEIRNDPSRIEDIKKLDGATAKTDFFMAASNRQFDPFWINSPVYDSIASYELDVYNDLFNDELGSGGWDNINKAHWKNISKALDQYKGQGKRILITYGAGHKGWFLRKLKERDDIELLQFKSVVNATKI